MCERLAVSQRFDPGSRGKSAKWMWSVLPSGSVGNHNQHRQRDVEKQGGGTQYNQSAPPLRPSKTVIVFDLKHFEEASAEQAKTSSRT